MGLLGRAASIGVPDGVGGIRISEDLQRAKKVLDRGRSTDVA
jgi:hypothetical protein